MKKSYLIPDIRIQAIDTEDLMEEQPLSLPIFNGTNPDYPETETITSGEEILGNKSSVWDE